MRNIQILSLSHTNVSADVRELFHKNSDRLRSFVQQHESIVGHVYVHTCNRVELIIEAKADIRYDIWKLWCRLSHVGYTDVKYSTHFGMFDCQRYLLQVALGLRSVVPGDDQILSQIKQSFESSRKSNQMSTLLERSYQSVMQCHKEVCRDTNFRQHSISLAYHTLKEIREHFDKKISNKKVLILGAGDMALQVIKYMDRFAFDKVHIANRTLAKAQLLVEDKNIDAIAVQDLDEHYDVVISCIPNGAQYLSNTAIDLYADLAAQHIGDQLDAEHIVTLEYMQHKMAEMKKFQFGELNTVRKIISNHATQYMKWGVAWAMRNDLRSA